jgi:PKD repeat protein
MKLRVLIGFLCLIVGLNAKAQCNASFNDTSTVCAVIQFTDMSTGTNSLTQYFWNFPQGSPSTSTLQSPSATYTANGNYTVCLSIFNASPTCSSTACQTITINCFTTSCTANFNSSVCVPSGTNAQMFFSNTSPGTNSTTVYEWDLGNSATSTLINPTATYSANGTYSVCLSYTTYAPAYCTASICKTVNINCVPVNSCAANFFSVTCVSNTVTNSAQVSFSNTSTGTNSTTTYFWNFGNTSTSTATNGITTYTANGTYTVCLSISTGSLCSDSICNVITVSCVPLPSPTCQANFTNTACNNGQMTFYSISSGTLSNTTYTWGHSAAKWTTGSLHSNCLFEIHKP